MKTIKTLHLASFDGNVGDNANHSGFYRHLKAQPGYDFAIEQLEIREYYWKQRFFDDGFVDLVNDYDLLIIGGGNYFELWAWILRRVHRKPAAAGFGSFWPGCWTMTSISYRFAMTARVKPCKNISDPSSLIGYCGLRMLVCVWKSTTIFD